MFCTSCGTDFILLEEMKTTTPKDIRIACPFCKVQIVLEKKDNGDGFALLYCIGCRKRFGCKKGTYIRAECVSCSKKNSCFIKRNMDCYPPIFDDTSSVCPDCREKHPRFPN